ncbi:adenosylmethionine--8-amino-7-oxononanoate transaminase [uncultured Desulfovibrio sp.]|uniref:adenosylmethionine--8-amino-7-oxononanoate transaminase n=1 Tax=uncultured Desulfovibrio sp. TaxID=167968 RepID=UPI0025EE5E35|nr:adenosylmethionine--8-amino-7-oxononanoate transaminase [uncultured Desulfovibrio sp.]
MSSAARQLLADATVFISGTGTDVGKSVATAALLRALRQAGLPVQAVKPVQTGVEDAAREGDAARYAQAVADMPPGPLPPAATLHSFRLPASPHLAAAREGRELTVSGLRQDIETHWRTLMAAQTGDGPCAMLLEGAGGLRVPFNEQEDTLDLMAVLAAPVVIVARNELGALNQIRLTLDAVRDRGLVTAGLVLTPPPDALATPDEATQVILADNERWLRARLDAEGIPVAVLPWVRLNAAGWERLAQAVRPVAQALAALLRTPSHTAEALVRRDKKVLWHPYTSATHPLPVFVARRSHHNRLVLADGRELVDGMSSWWAAVHGYNHPRLLAALRAQAGRMPHVMFGGLTHAPAVELAERLLDMLPQGLARVFPADSGSVAVEVALKMALQYQQGIGQKQRTRFLTPRGGYHGDTTGAMSVCDPVTGMHSLFARMLPQQLFMERPRCRFDQPFDPASLDDARQQLAAHGHEVAAVILEPVVQGAGGMWFYHPDYLRGLAQLCREAGALLIFDEIATGFGRTGTLFAAERAGVTPDILCCGKALTGGVLTLAATVCTEQVTDGICRDGNVFMHGPTYMGNPLACAVALASLRLLEEEDWRTRVQTLEKGLRQGLAPCADLPGVADVRVLGGIGVVETTEPVPVARLQAFFVEHGVWIRPFGRLIYLMPPYVTPTEDLARLCEAVVDAVRQGVHRPYQDV